MASMSRTLERIKQELAELIPSDLIERTCRELKYDYRERKLPPLVTIHLFVQQVLNYNTAISNLPHLSKMRFDPSAYCEARRRVPLAVLERLLRHVADAVRARGGDRGLWLGHRTWLLDGSSCSMPDTPDLQAAFGQSGQQKAGCGFPTAHLLAMFDASSGMLMEVIAAPLRTSDFALVSMLHPLMQTGDVVVADRGFCSYVHMAMLQSKGIHAVLRLHQRVPAPFDPPRPHGRGCVPGQSLGVQDQLVRWHKPKTKPGWIGREAFDALPATLELRVLRYRVGDGGCRSHVITLVTTLLDPVRYTKGKLARLFAIRWRVEGDLRDLKITLKMDVLKCRSADGVRKELAIYAVVYNLVCLVRQRAAVRQRVVDPSRLSFVDVLRWLQTAEPGEEMPRFIVNPRRPGRHEPRVYKRRHKEFDRMTKPRSAYKNPRQLQAQKA
jgi:hypothetical protein